MTPLSFAAIGVASLDVAVAFYCERIGFDLKWSGMASADLMAMLGLPPVAVRLALLCACQSEVGQILLIEVDVPGRQLIRQPGDRTSRGLWNLNFYVADVRATATMLAEQGFALWSDPVEYVLGPAAGSAIEVLFEAPDGVAINLVQPLGNPDVFTGRIRVDAERAGRTRTGFSPVATTANCVVDMAAALHFYQGLLGNEVLLDEVLGKPETNHFLMRPVDARSRTVFLGGGHFLGKLSLNQPLNYPVAERANAAVPTSIGYFAQGFLTPDLAAAVISAESLGAKVIGPSATFALDGEQPSIMRLVRAPDDGALLWLVEQQ